MVDINALFSISYGLYIVTSGTGENGNGYISNTVFQVTAEPIKFATCCNKNNFTANLIKESGHFGVSVLSIKAGGDLIGNFGFKSGKETKKLAGYTIKQGKSGIPLVQDSAVATMEFKVVDTVDVGSHLMFIGEAIETIKLNDETPLTYDYYRSEKNGAAPKNAPTYIDKSKFDIKDVEDTEAYRCPICGYEHHITEGDKNKGIEPGTTWNDIDESYTCPLCGAEKSEFYKL